MDQGIPFFRDFGRERGIYSVDVNIAKFIQNYSEINKKSKTATFFRLPFMGILAITKTK